jgi:hypothetical protein
MNRAITAHKLRPVIDRVFAFEEAREGASIHGIGAHFGKIRHSRLRATGYLPPASVNHREIRGLLLESGAKAEEIEIFRMNASIRILTLMVGFAALETTGLGAVAGLTPHEAFRRRRMASLT